MKKKARKLVLSRETLVNLDPSHLAQAAGGTSFSQHTCPSYTCYPGNCDFTGRNTCNTCEFTCTTNQC